MRALALLLLLCVGLMSLSAWQAHTAPAPGLLAAALFGAWRLWKSE